MYQICSRCVMDTSTRLISFDHQGVCSYCHEYDSLAAQTVNRPRDERYHDYQQIVNEIKEAGKNNDYDCIVGLSGGMDSSYMALVAKEAGLRPLVVHFDNGWNSELAVKNIENIVNKLGFDLFTYVINWDEFKDLQLAYFRASVIDIEVPTDQLIFATLYKLAKDKNIKYILSGNNIRTELTLPGDWCFLNKNDYVNLRNIHAKFGKVKLKDFPRLSYDDRQYYKKKLGVKLIPLFQYLDFNVKEVRERLKNELNWTPYPYKHYESIFTRFYQGYILPKKFKVDKRRAHLATLVQSGQLTRAEAIEELKKPTYPIDEQLADKGFVLKKWGLSNEEFEQVIQQTPIPHEFYGTEEQEFRKGDLLYKLKLIYLYKFAYPLGILKRPTQA